MFRRASAAQFADLSITSRDDFEVADLEEQGCELLQKAILDMEDGFFEERDQHAPAQRKAAKDAQKEKRQSVATAREEACLGSRMFQRMPSDRQTYRPLDEQCNEWASLKPNLRVRGFSSQPAQQRSMEQQDGVQEVQVQPLKRSMNAWSSDLGPRKTSWSGPSQAPQEASVPEGNARCSETGTSGTTGHSLGVTPTRQGQLPHDSSPDTPGPELLAAGLCVQGQALGVREQQQLLGLPPGAVGAGACDDEEVLASDGVLSEVLALQHDALEAHVKRAPQPQAPHPVLSMVPSRRPSNVGEACSQEQRGSASAPSRQPRLSDASGLRGVHGMSAAVLKRDEKAMRIGLPAVEPALSLLQQATDQAFDSLWQQLVPILLPLVQQRLEARLAQRQEAARQEAERKLRALRLAEEREERKRQRSLEVEFQGLGDGAAAQEQEQELEEESSEHTPHASSGNSEDASEQFLQPGTSHMGAGGKGPGGLGRPPPHSGGRNTLRATGRLGLGQGFLAPLGYIQTESPPRLAPSSSSSSSSPFVNTPAQGTLPLLLTATYGHSFLTGHGDREMLLTTISDPQGMTTPPPLSPPPPPPPPTGRFWQSAGSGSQWTLRKRCSSLQPLLPQGMSVPAKSSSQCPAPGQAGGSQQRAWPPAGAQSSHPQSSHPQSSHPQSSHHQSSHPQSSHPQSSHPQSSVMVATLNGRPPLFSTPPPPPPPPPRAHYVRSPPPYPPQPPPPPPRHMRSTYPPGVGGAAHSSPLHAAGLYAPPPSFQAPQGYASQAGGMGAADQSHAASPWLGSGQEKGWKQGQGQVQESETQQQWQQRQHQHQQQMQMQQQMQRRGSDILPRPPVGQWGPAPPPPPPGGGFQKAQSLHEQLSDPVMSSGTWRHQRQLPKPALQQHTPMLPRLQAQISQSPR